MTVRVENRIPNIAGSLPETLESCGRADWTEGDPRPSPGSASKLVRERDKEVTLPPGVLEPESGYGHTVSKRMRASDALGRRYAAYWPARATQSRRPAGRLPGIAIPACSRSSQSVGGEFSPRQNG
jgi:hypothetical protein